MPWLRRLFAGLTLRKLLGFDPNPVHVRFVRDKVHQFCILIFSHVLFLPEGQTKLWNLLKNIAIPEVREHWTESTLTFNLWKDFVSPFVWSYGRSSLDVESAASQLANIMSNCLLYVTGFDAGTPVGCPDHYPLLSSAWRRKQVQWFPDTRPPRWPCLCLRCTDSITSPSGHRLLQQLHVREIVPLARGVVNLTVLCCFSSDPAGYCRDSASHWATTTSMFQIYYSLFFRPAVDIISK